MSLQEIYDMAQTGVVGVIVILLGLIRIPKIEVNLWTLLGRAVGRVINQEINAKIDHLTKDFEQHLKDEEEERMRMARQRILRFNDEGLFGKGHSKEHYDEILEDIDVYEQYCAEHPDYKNNKAVIAIATIKDANDDCMQDHSFMVYKKHQRN